MVAIALLVFAAGLAVGSFAGVVAHRLPRGEGFVSGRSRCDHCGGPVAARDNVPLLSWLLLRGRCRHCGEAIPVVYPLVELGVALAFLGTYLVLEEEPELMALGFVFVTLLAIITLTDLEQMIIPNLVVGAGVVVGLAMALALGTGDVVERLIAMAAAGGGLFVVAFAYPRGMGMGDVKLTAMMGVFLGRAIAPAMLVGFLAGTIVGVALIARQGSSARKRRVPFGPFLAVGGIVGLLAGEAIVDAYLDTFFDQ